MVERSSRVFVTASVLAVLLATPGVGLATVPASFIAAHVELRPLSLDLAARELDDGLLWVPEADGNIGPGRALRIEFPDGALSGCTGNFIWRDGDGRLYLGTAGHCVLPSDASATHGPEADYDASGVIVSFATPCDLVPSFFVVGIVTCLSPSDYVWVPLGRVAFAEQGVAGRDFAIVEIPPELHDRIRHDVPGWGVPNGSRTAELGEAIVHYGHGLGYEATPATRHRTGVVTTHDAVHDMLVEPTVLSFLGGVNSGDSGSAAAIARDPASGDFTAAEGTGIITHGLSYVAGVFFGTSTETAKFRTRCFTGLAIILVPGDDAPADPSSCTWPPGTGPGEVHVIQGNSIEVPVEAGRIHNFTLHADAPFRLYYADLHDFGQPTAAAATIRPIDADLSTPGCQAVAADWTTSASFREPVNLVVATGAFGPAHTAGIEHPAGSYAVDVAADITAVVTLTFSAVDFGTYTTGTTTERTATFTRAVLETSTTTGTATASDAIPADVTKRLGFAFFHANPTVAVGMYASEVHIDGPTGRCAAGTDSGLAASHEGLWLDPPESVGAAALMAPGTAVTWNGDFQGQAAAWGPDGISLGRGAGTVVFEME